MNDTATPRQPLAQTDVSADASTAAILRAEHVRFGYHADKVVIDDLSVTLAAGRLCALVGPNAVGKTTLLKLLVGELRPWSGQLEVCGHAVQPATALARAARCGYVPQRTHVSFAFTAREVVAMGRFASADDPAQVEGAMTLCDLASLGDRVFAELSAGQQQRVLLARAIAQIGAGRADQPLHGRLMLLDEPTSAMDLRHMHEAMSRLAGLCERGLAVLVVLHDLNLAAQYASDIWLMDGGRLVQAGPWSSILQPDVLEPVYGVVLRDVAHDRRDRPVFAVELPGESV